MSIDLSTYTDTDLAALRVQVLTETDRRRRVAEAPERSAELSSDYLAATGVKPGDEWSQPHAAYDAYPLGWTVTHGGKTWTSLVAANVWEPGVANWREETTGGTPPAWVQPTGAGDAYAKGDQVTYEGHVYESLIAANVWAPDAYPAGWKLIG